MIFSDKYGTVQMNAINSAADDANSGVEIINLSIGDHDVITNESVIAQAFSDVVKGYTKYTHPLGLEDLRLAIDKLNRDQYGHEVALDQIMVTVGACHGMVLTLKALINPGDEVIIIAPYFPIYKQQIEDVEGISVVVNTEEKNGFVPQIDAIKEQITSKTRAIIINSPCNPSGAVLDYDFLKELHELSKEYNLVIISDEVYTAFTYNDYVFISMLEVDPGLTHTVILRSLSKDYAMTGWRLGYMMSNEALIGVSRYINEFITYSAPTVSQRAALWALKQHDVLTGELQQLYETRVNYCYERIQMISKLDVIEPQGSIYLFVNVSGTGMDGDAFCKELLKKAGVLMLPGDIFGEAYGNYVRMACNQDIEILKEAFNRIEVFLK